jgi:hypothetical protein
MDHSDKTLQGCELVIPMNLDEWNVLSHGERDERRRRWIPRVPPGQVPEPEEVEWQGLVMEAERRLIAEFGDLPDILCIGSSAWFDDQHPVAVIVRTRLSDGQRLGELPNNYMSFPVEQEPVGDEVEAFKKTWHAILSRLFDWPDSSIRDWIGNQEWVFRSVFFLHDPPCEYLQRVPLARSVVGRREESELRRIGEELVRAIEGRSYYVDEDAGYDWGKAREKVTSVIRRYPPWRPVA